MNMYNNKLAACIKVAGKVLRESNQSVKLPFGQEYSIQLKNLNTVRALVSISIDGEDIADGTRFVVHPNSTFEIERFVKNNNLNAGNRFKFIERTASIEENRDNKIDDGIVRIEFQFEKVDDTLSWRKSQPQPYPWGDNPPNDWDRITNTPTYPTPYNNPVMRGLFSQSVSLSVNEVGITAPGSVSDQSFTSVSGFVTHDEKHAIVFHLLGVHENGGEVVEAINVKKKPKCVTCKRLNKATAKFCVNCGTSLVLV